MHKRKYGENTEDDLETLITWGNVVGVWASSHVIETNWGRLGEGRLVVAHWQSGREQYWDEQEYSEQRPQSRGHDWQFSELSHFSSPQYEEDSSFFGGTVGARRGGIVGTDVVGSKGSTESVFTIMVWWMEYSGGPYFRVYTHARIEWWPSRIEWSFSHRIPLGIISFYQHSLGRRDFFVIYNPTNWSWSDRWRIDKSNTRR